MHLYSKYLSTITLISSLILSELLPAGFLEVIMLIYHLIRQDQMVTLLYFKYQRQKPLNLVFQAFLYAFYLE